MKHQHDNEAPRGKHARHAAPSTPSNSRSSQGSQNSQASQASQASSRPQNPQPQASRSTQTTRVPQDARASQGSQGARSARAERVTPGQQNPRQQNSNHYQNYRNVQGTPATPSSSASSPSEYSRSSATYHNRKRGKKKVRNGILIGVGVLLVAFIGFGVALGLSALNVKDQAPQLMNTATALKNDLQSENSEALVSDAQKLNTQIASLKEEVNGPLWTIGSFIPVLGEDISAGQKLINVASNLSEEVLMPISGVLADYPLNTIYKDGNINGDALNLLCDTLANAAPTIAESAQTVDGIGTVHIGQINQLTEKLKDPLNMASQFMADNGDAFRLIPDLLGCNGDREYLIIAQNYSEVRPTGGLPGTVIPLHVSNGNLDFGDPVAMADARNAQNYPIQITDEERTLFGDILGYSTTDMNNIPDWSRAADIISQMWAIYNGTTVDGVIGIDVETFKRLVSLGSSTVALPDGSTVNSADLTKILLHDVYVNYPDGAMQDAYFSMVLGSCMDIIEGKLPDLGLQKVANVIQQSIQEERLMVWMRNTEEEALMEQLGCAGTLSYDPKTPEVGLYFYDLTWSKIDWYFKPEVTLGDGVKNTDGTTSYPMTIKLTNTLTYGDAENLPVAVTGIHPTKQDVTDMLTNVYLYAPAGGTISNIQYAGVDGFSLNPATHNGLEVHFGLLHLLAQQSETISCTVTTSKDATEPLTLRMMQTAH